MPYTLNSIIYRVLIDPILSSYYSEIIGEINEGDKVLDIASGTGSLALRLADRAKIVTGIDLAEDMVELANHRAAKMKKNNAGFLLMDASDLSYYMRGDFNIAITSMAIHQFDPDLAVQILREMKRIAPVVIIMDYNYPIKKTIPRMAVRLVEWIAGGDHFRNFRKYNKHNGLNHYLHKANLKITEEKLPGNATFRIVVCA